MEHNTIANPEISSELKMHFIGTSPVMRTSVIRKAPPEIVPENGTCSSSSSLGHSSSNEELKELKGNESAQEPASCSGLEVKSRKRGAGSRLELPLREKIKVINARDSGKTMRQIALEFGCGKTQILNILSRRERYQKEWDVVCKVGFLGGGADRKRAARRTGNEETNRRVYEWWKEAEATGIRVTGPLLQNTARSIARKLGFFNFAASNGWLASFRKTYGVQLKHDLAMERQNAIDSSLVSARMESNQTPKVEESCQERLAGMEASDSIDSKSLVEVLMEDEPHINSPCFKSELSGRSSKSPLLGSIPEEVPSLLSFVMRHAHHYHLTSLPYPDEEDNWWLEIRPRSASYAVPHFGYRSHLFRLLISQDLGYWLEVLGDCISWGSLCNHQGDLDVAKLDSILASMRSDSVCAGTSEVNTKSRDPNEVRFATASRLSMGAFISRPDFRFRSFNCARLVPNSKNPVVCRQCLSLSIDPRKVDPIRSHDFSHQSNVCSNSHEDRLSPSSVDYSHPKKKMKDLYSDEVAKNLDSNYVQPEQSGVIVPNYSPN
ncbi:uncharacterized protein LOC136033168 [Artemia franciscana]|uniref:uncharacterized protein LOC136033168 n=1 Tax=Artemia franciscana TaxID=6661 RepID=UPI0032DA9031